MLNVNVSLVICAPLRDGAMHSEHTDEDCEAECVAFLRNIGHVEFARAGVP